MTGMSVSELNEWVARGATDVLRLKMGNGLIILYGYDMYADTERHGFYLEGPRNALFPLKRMRFFWDADAFLDAMGGVVDVLEIV